MYQTTAPHVPQGRSTERALDAAAAGMLASDNRGGVHFHGYHSRQPQTLMCRGKRHRAIDAALLLTHT